MTGIAKRITALRMDDDLLRAMRTLQQRDGISLSEQMRRALRPWLAAKGVIRAGRTRASHVNPAEGRDRSGLPKGGAARTRGRRRS